MIHIRPILKNDVNALSGTSYDRMSAANKQNMIRDSLAQSYQGSYFELFTVLDDDKVVGFMNVYARSEHIVSISPEIKEEYRKQGYAYAAEMLVLEMVRNRGFYAAYASVRKDNSASLALHKKLRFEKVAECTGKQGKPAVIFIKPLTVQ